VEEEEVALPRVVEGVEVPPQPVVEEVEVPLPRVVEEVEVHKPVGVAREAEGAGSGVEGWGWAHVELDYSHCSDLLACEPNFPKYEQLPNHHR